MLILPIKKKWYDMILSGNQKEAYLEMKLYWQKKFVEMFGKRAIYPKPPWASDKSVIPTVEIMFRNGYSKNSPSFIARCMVSIGTGREEWGAEKGRQYFVLTIHEILKEVELSVPI